MSSAPKNILYIRADTFGDLILFSPTLSHLIKQWPEAKHTILVRAGYDRLKSLFPDQLNWKTIAVNPYKSSPSAACEELQKLLTDLHLCPPDLIIAATLSRTWLEILVASKFPEARRVSLGRESVHLPHANILRLNFGINPDEIFPEIIEPAPRALDWENGLRIADHLLGVTVERQVPTLPIPAEATARAACLLHTHALPTGQWIACYPAGVANISIKAWPADRFAETLCRVQHTHQLKVLLLGHHNESGIVHEVAQLIEKAGLPPPPIWLSNDDEFILLAAILQQARLYLGNDTGPMHLAAAVGTPTIGIFGGGHWPRFKLVGRQVVSVVQPLPCFGCMWDCPFAEAPCVKTLPITDIETAVRRLLAAGSSHLDIVIESQYLSVEVRQLIAITTPVYRQKQQSLQEQLISKDVHIHNLEEIRAHQECIINELRGSLDNMPIGYSQQEQVKPTKLRPNNEKSAPPQQACGKRKSLIQQLARKLIGYPRP